MTNGENSLCLWSHGSVLILRSDAAAEHAVPAETPGAAAGPPGSQCDDHGLHLAGSLFYDPGHTDLSFFLLRFLPK